jgi:hypothetical protein
MQSLPRAVAAPLHVFVINEAAGRYRRSQVGSYATLYAVPTCQALAYLTLSLFVALYRCWPLLPQSW